MRSLRSAGFLSPANTILVPWKGRHGGMCVCVGGWVCIRVHWVHLEWGGEGEEGQLVQHTALSISLTSPNSLRPILAPRQSTEGHHIDILSAAPPAPGAASHPARVMAPGTTRTHRPHPRPTPHSTHNLHGVSACKLRPQTPAHDGF
jgi:hypothetical protein